ncbi:MAG: patatin-like phospholipase family protein [Alphaproteobacteria bacterium]|nr:patatin-like phospholipase family protein [Alphaproteobacteria bacterium]
MRAGSQFPAALAAALVLAIAPVFAGCASYKENPHLAVVDETTGYRYSTLSSDGNTDDLFVILALSGGGTRAAAFSYGLMEGLRAARYVDKDTGAPRTLLEDVDVISAVSGGSFTAAYYGLFGKRLFNEFKKDFLERDVDGDLIKRALLPTNWMRLSSSTFDRIDLAAEYYNETIFKEKTYQALLDHRRKPFIILNATDMSLGRRFEFTQDQFDLLCSDLAKVKVARAVAASSAFPGLLSPLTLKNHAKKGCGYKKPKWLENALNPLNPPWRYFRGVDLWSYQERARDQQYVHLLDGGLSDNIGLRGPLVALISETDSAWSVLQLINDDKVKRVVVITANAKTKAHKDWDQKQAAPGLFDVLGFVATGPMDNYSFETVQRVTDFFEQEKQNARTFADCQERFREQCPAAEMPLVLPTVDVHAVEISFDGIADDRLRLCMEGLPTNFSLPAPTVDLLRQVARNLLLTSPKFQDAMNGLEPRWEPPESAIDPNLIAAVCPR